ncbi:MULTISPECIES: hypothetical protein [unclassified Pseudoclavibacter]|nr:MULTISPECIES: hypothetical protein [unclassified Pseudoclavibacter]MBF4551128.1 hypothetical protein [Pseudoclavibacter sp. VKM Ac-2888]
MRSLVLVPVVLPLDAAAGVLWSRMRGAEAIDHVVATARQRAADSRAGGA